MGFRIQRDLGGQSPVCVLQAGASPLGLLPFVLWPGVTQQWEEWFQTSQAAETPRGGFTSSENRVPGKGVVASLGRVQVAFMPEGAGGKSKGVVS